MLSVPYDLHHSKNNVAAMLSHAAYLLHGCLKPCPVDWCLKSVGPTL